MKNIFLGIQAKLAELPELKYIDKNWGQLLYELPPVKFPCALLDINAVDYSQLGALAQNAAAVVEITIANFRMVSSSAKAPNKEEAYTVFDIIERIHQLLHGFSTGEFSPLIRTGLKKLDTARTDEIYSVNYKTAWQIMKTPKFIPIQTTFKLTICKNGEGIVVPAPGEYYFAPDTVVFLSATGTGENEFVKWTGDINSTETTIQVIMNSKKTVAANFSIPQIETIVMWNFDDMDAVADYGIPENLNRTVKAVNVPATTTAPDVVTFGEWQMRSCIMAWDWRSGVTQMKHYLIDFTTAEHRNIVLSFYQGSAAGAPRDWKLQYSFDGITFEDLNVNYFLAANFWVLMNNIALPQSCNNKEKVYIRWQMTSLTAANGSAIALNSNNAITDIIIKGSKIN
jgi:hypothetical protein